MRNLKLILEYDGSKFFGFQKQPNHPTIQEALEKALSGLFQKKTKITSASGRTDTGVHAEYQVVNFKTNSTLPVTQIQKALNARLPESIAVKEAEEVNPDFHARYSARSKTYEYRIWNDPVRSPLRAKQVCYIPEPLDISKMKRAAAVLKGRHDFRSFGTNRGDGKTIDTVRTVKRIEIRTEAEAGFKPASAFIRIQIEADGFLYRMVRNIAGTLIDAGRGKLGPSGIRRILEAKDRRRAAMTAPAEGLFLVDVKYR